MGPDFIALLIWKYGLQIIVIYNLFENGIIFPSLYN